MTFFLYSCHYSYYLPVSGLAYQSDETKCGNIDIALQGFLEQGYQSKVSLLFHVVLPEESVYEIAPFSIEIAVEDSVISDYQFWYDDNWISNKEMKEPFYMLKEHFVLFGFDIFRDRIDSKSFSIQADEFMVCNGDIHALPRVDFLNDENVKWTKITKDIYPFGSLEK